MENATLQVAEMPGAQACACAACAARSERLAYQQAVLRELNELSMRVARAVCDEAEAARQAAPGDEAPPRRTTADPTLAMTRIARSVRLNLALEARLTEDAPAAEARRVDHAAERKAEAIRGLRAKRAEADTRKSTVFEAVEIIIDFDAPEGETESLLDRLEDLRDPALEARFADAPTSAWIAAICRDLDLTPDWNLWAGEDWALEEAVTRPDSPFAKLFGFAPPGPPPEARPEPDPGLGPRAPP